MGNRPLIVGYDCMPEGERLIYVMTLKIAAVTVNDISHLA